MYVSVYHLYLTCIPYHLHCQCCCWARCHSIGNITMFIVPTGVPSTLNKKCPSLHIVAVVLAVCDQIESNP